MRSLVLRVAAPLLAAVLLLLAVASPAAAHPLGNTTVNHYDGLELSPEGIVDHAVEDLAEIPTFQRRAQVDTDGSGKASASEQTAYATARCADMARTLVAKVGGDPVEFRVLSSSYTERAGAVGLSAGRLECELFGKAQLTTATTVEFRNPWDDDGIGWHEITAVGKGVVLRDSPFPATSISDALRAYPDDLLSSPLNVRGGSVRVLPGTGSSTYDSVKDLPVAGPAAQYLNKLSTAFNNTAGQENLTLGVGLLGLLLALMLGAGHAFLPGHGKTIMAAYLVGKRGSFRDVVTVGATVTFTHTAGVLVLGLIITSSAAFAPAQAERWLGVVSGVIVALVGAGLLVSALRNPRRPSLQELAPQPELVTVGGHTHDHPHHDHDDHDDHDHDDHGHDGDHGHPHHDHGHPHPQRAVPAPHAHSHGKGIFARSHTHDPAAKGFSKGGLVGLGVAGGLVPSPSALLVLLAATALGRTHFGVLLVLGYGVGMALALCAAGLLLIKLRGRLERLAGSSRMARAERLLAVLPVLTALLVLMVGALLAIRALGGPA